MNNYSPVLRAKTNGKNHVKIEDGMNKVRTTACRTPEKVEVVAPNTG